MLVAHRPDPAKGVFETLLVIGGRPIELDAHLERLGSSLRTAFDAELPPGARQLALDGVRHLRLGRLRLTVAPTTGQRLDVEVAAESLEPALLFPPRERGVELRSLVVGGGLGAHKWVDRGLLERAEAATPGATPLVVDRDATVLEASRANVFAVQDGALVTPPADGRVIAGITRGRVLELAGAAGRELREERLSLANLLGADEVFLTNSVRGVEPARSIDGAKLGAGGGITAEIAAELRRGWLGEGEPAGSAAAAP